MTRFELRCHAWCYCRTTPTSCDVATRQHLRCDALVRYVLLPRRSTAAMSARGTFTRAASARRLVADDAYLLELARYLPLNPVRAGLCDSPADWQWSSYAATAGLVSAPPFLDRGRCLSFARVVDAYVSWVTDGILADVARRRRHSAACRHARRSRACSRSDSDQAIAGCPLRPRIQPGLRLPTTSESVAAQIGRRLGR